MANEYRKYITETDQKLLVNNVCGEIFQDKRIHSIGRVDDSLDLIIQCGSDRFKVHVQRFIHEVIKEIEDDGLKARLKNGT